MSVAPVLLTLPCFDDAGFTARIERLTQLSSGRVAYHGKLRDLPAGSITLVRSGDLVAGTIHAGAAGVYDIRLTDRGTHVVRERSPTAASCPHADKPLTTINKSTIGSRLKAQRQASLNNYAGCDDGSVIDLLFAYTPSARVSAGGVAQIEMLIHLSVAVTNQAMTDSEIGAQINLVAALEIAYTETGTWAIDGPRLAEPDDGHLDAVHLWRDQYGADCVCLLVDTLDAGGIGYFPHPSLTGVGYSGFSMLRLDGAGTLGLAHELGHNFYCAHDRANATDLPYAPYSYGYREPGNVWHTIMAYPPGFAVPFFANPDLNWSGTNPGPLGIPEGQPNPCDVARTINELRYFVANFRPTHVPGLPGVLYVRSDAPGGDGSSWAQAFNDLQIALCRAAGSGGAVQEIWVKQGTYRPDRGTGDRSASFRLIDGVAIYGGFAGTETQRDERNPAMHITVLSGDIGNPGDPADNSYHVINASYSQASALLDGVTIHGGQADGASFPDDCGGGALLNGDGAATFRNCLFSANQAADAGGGVYCYQASPTFEQCTFVDNIAIGSNWPSGGGAIYGDTNCQPILTACTFEANSGHFGGAIAVLNFSSPIIDDCLFRENIAAGIDAAGGAMYCYSSCSPAITTTSFTSNQAPYGAGLALYFSSSPTLTDVLFEDNYGPVNNKGAGLYAYSACDPQLLRCDFVGQIASYGAAAEHLFDCLPRYRNCRFLGNTVDANGGAVSHYSMCNAEYINCLFSGNQAAFGGAAINLFQSEAAYINCTISLNSASVSSGGVENYESDAIFTNTILWNNQVAGVMDQTAQLGGWNSQPVVNYCTIQGGAAGLGGLGNNGTDPLLLNDDGPDDVAGTVDDDPRPQAGSAAVNSGNNSDVPSDATADLDGGPRVLQTIVDRGAYEFVPIFPMDLDQDGDVDGQDLVRLMECATGPALPYPANLPPSCTLVPDGLGYIAADGDQDFDVDQSDFGLYQRCHSGADLPVTCTP